eukprot:gb/GECG01015981.1/.p1 GENE.gb/GECG01015981.1/~~gb/GECG01015981.1/.p1  ORF type:complete len:506 (+),score=37.91 gb/GECG01015981.1/:1-1518(+)
MARADPKTWTVQGSDDKQFWFLLHQHSITDYLDRSAPSGPHQLTSGRPTASPTNTASRTRTASPTTSVSSIATGSVTTSATAESTSSRTATITELPTGTGTATSSKMVFPSLTPRGTSRRTTSPGTTPVLCSPTMADSKSEVCLAHRLSPYSVVNVENLYVDIENGRSLETRNTFLLFQSKLSALHEGSIDWKLSLFRKLFRHLATRSGYALFSNNNKVCVFGGLESSAESGRYHYDYTNHVCCAEAESASSCTQSSVGAVPTPRGFSSWWSTEQRHYLFGGQAKFDSNGDYGLLNDLWEYEMENSKWSKLTDGSDSGPSARRDSITWLIQGVLLLYGGYGAYPGEIRPQHLDDLWQLKVLPVCEGGGHEWTKLEPHSLSKKFPSPRRLGGATVMNSIALMFGGESKRNSRKPSHPYLSDLWALEFCSKERGWVWKELPLSDIVSCGFGGRTSCLLTAQNVNMDIRVDITGGYGYQSCYSTVADRQMDTLSVLLNLNGTMNHHVR